MRISAPGKLFIAGEWAVLDAGNPGIVAAVNKRVWVEIEDDSKITVSVKDFDIHGIKGEFNGKELKWLNAKSEEEERLIFMKVAIETALGFLGEYKPFRITSWGELSQIEVNGEKKKIGFGSSAASVVATIAGVLALHEWDIKNRKVKDIIYKLSAVAHYFAQGKIGSGFDVAASTYGGIFVYKRFDPKWLVKKLEEGKTVKEVIELDWPGFEVTELDIPDGFELLVGWTGESASTTSMVKQLNEWAREKPEEKERIYKQVAELVKNLVEAWKTNDKKRILELIRKNEDYLRELGKKSGIPIETPELRKLSEIANKNGGAGKLSGAGGGDCGIAVVFDSEISEKIKKEWEENGIQVLDVSLDLNGVKKQ